MNGLQGIAVAQRNIGFVRQMKQSAREQYGTGNAQPGKVYGAEYLFALYQAVGKVQENKGAAAQLQQGSVGEDIATVISFGHAINFVNMEFQKTQFCCVDCGKSKPVRDLPNIDLLDY